MARYRFHGRVLPERAYVSMDPITFGRSDDPRLECTLWVDTSAVTVDIHTDLNVDLVTLKNTVEDLIRAQVDSFGFLTSRAYDLEIVSGGPLDGAPVTFGVAFESGDLEPLGLDFAQVRKHALHSLFLRIALSDLREAIRAKRDAALFCARAVDAVSEHFRPTPESKKSQVWAAMRETLNIDEAFLKYVTSEFQAVRHANFHEIRAIDAADRSELLRRTRAVVARFVRYLETAERPSAMLAAPSPIAELRGILSGMKNDFEREPDREF